MKKLCFNLILLLFPVLVFASDDLVPIFIAEGDSYTEDMGYSVQSPGDLNGNGFPEVFVGSVGSQQVKVFEGGFTPNTTPIKIYENCSGTFKWVDDLNGDGYKDLLLYNKNYGESPDSLDLYLGGENFYDKNSPDYTFTYPSGNRFAYDIQSEDADNDGEKELIISVPSSDDPYDGIFYIYETFGEISTTPSDSLCMLYGGLPEVSIAVCLGDVNNDGYADYGTSATGTYYPSFVDIFLGSEDLDGVADLRIWSPFEDAPGVGHFGQSINPLGDINRDGYADILVGSVGFPATIYYGGNPVDTIPVYLQYEGIIGKICGDINYDGYNDIAVSWTDYSFGSGIVFVYYGSKIMESTADIIIPYDNLSPQPYALGKSLGYAGDFNGDGVDDLAVGADGTINPYNNKGYLWIFAGDSLLPTPAEDEIDHPIPQKYNMLYQNYPNPFNNQTIIEYELWGVFDREIELSIYNILGQNVRTLYQGIQSGGKHIAYWDGKDGSSHPVSSGIYFYRLSSQNEIISKKMIYLK